MIVFLVVAITKEVRAVRSKIVFPWISLSFLVNKTYSLIFCNSEIQEMALFVATYICYMHISYFGRGS